MANTTNRNPQRPPREPKSKSLRISEEMPEIERRRSEPAKSLDRIDELWPDMSPDVKRIVSRLGTYADDVEKWFIEDPQRIRGLAKDPKKTIERLAKDFGLDGVRYAEIDAADVALAVNYPLKSPLGTSLLMAVWDHVALKANGFKLLMADPNSVIHKVADNTGASGAATRAVIEAFRLAFNSATADRNTDLLAGNWAHAVRRSDIGFRLRVTRNGM